MKVLFISGDSDARVHAREWNVPKRKNIDWDEEFLKCLDHYEANGHYVARGFNELNPEFPVDEHRILTIEISGHFKFIGDYADG
jgi:hypothetical protein